MLGDLYTLRLQDTEAWPSFQGDPDNFPEPSRVADYLSKNGVILGDTPIKILSGGDVLVWAFNSPEFAWPLFANAATASETELEADLAIVKELGPTSDNRLLAAMARLLLRALQAGA